MEVESKTVTNWYWDEIEYGVPRKTKPHKSGWYCSWEDKFISDDEALEYALDQLQEDGDTKEEFADYAADYIFTHKEVQRAFVDWYFRRWKRLED